MTSAPPSGADPRATFSLEDAAPALLGGPALLGVPAIPGAPPLPSGPALPALDTRSGRYSVLPRVSRIGGQPVLRTERRPRYATGATLGTGGSGEVLDADDNDIGRKVAIKRLRADRRSEAAVLRFVEEVHTVGRLEHPNIVPIHDVGLDEDGNYFFVMKRVQGETLDQVIRRLSAGEAEAHRHYTFERRLDIFIGILEAVCYAHSRGIVHRDLKPANVMVGAFGEVQVLDWGLARGGHGGDGPAGDIRPEEGWSGDARPGGAYAEYVQPEDLRSGDFQPLTTAVTAVPVASPTTGPAEGGRAFETRQGTIIGTPAYMAPEQARGEATDARSDVYALTVLLHEFLTLRHYLSDRSRVEDILQGVLTVTPPLRPPLGPHQGQVPADLHHLLSEWHQKDPSARPTVAAMLGRLRARKEGDIEVHCHVTFTRKMSSKIVRFGDNHPLAFAGVLAAIPFTFGLLSWAAFWR